MAEIAEQERPATPEECAVLERWTGWGAVPHIFEDWRDDWTSEREELRSLLDESDYADARQSTLNAHYTDPFYAHAIWDALAGLGFNEGRVLEPGSGSGSFIAAAPDGARMTGIELDPTTARIAQALHPEATILCESFAETDYPDDFFDAAIGNVPFADVQLDDPRHNAGRHSIHNHFILKSLALTRPGGLVAVVTSRHTLDGRRRKARREMAALADLLGAVRLPSGAHRKAAGTEVVTDVLLLRRREPGREPASDWESTTTREVDGSRQLINTYFDEHPEHVLGELGVGSGAFGQELVVRGDVAAAGSALSGALQEIVSAAEERGLVYVPPAVESAPALAPARRRDDERWEGHLTALPNGRFTVLEDGEDRPMKVPASQANELRSLLALRDDVAALVAAEARTRNDTPELVSQRRRLRQRYEAYVALYGYINRAVSPATTTLRIDPGSSLVRALENFNEISQTATRAAILDERVSADRKPLLHASSPAEALFACLDQRGAVDLERIADLLDRTPEQARRDLGDLIYDDPASGELTPAARYLAGDVRTKLEQARAAVIESPAFERNVEALERVVPADLSMEDIEATLGASWIDDETHRQFLAELLDDDKVVVQHAGGGMWDVKGKEAGVKERNVWGTIRKPASVIMKTLLELRPVQVFDRDPKTERRRLNLVETAAAQEKAEALQERFSEWVWEEPERATRLVSEYNRRFNSHVLRDYSAEAKHLTLPGLASTFTPHPHQLMAVARVLNEPAAGLFHCVGAGKTAEMVMGIMELKRLGRISKPVVLVPNYMLDQFARDWVQLYPEARVLAASSRDLERDKRRLFVKRAVTNNWDVVVMTRTAFEGIPVSSAGQRAYLQRELTKLENMLVDLRMRGARTASIKRMEKKLLRAKERMKEKLRGTKDPGVVFEQMGIDFIGVDEIHDYKNLLTRSNIRDAAIAGSKRATDLHMKLELLRERYDEPVIVGATATPIANAVAETHVMERYFRPDLLEAAGVLDFDRWAATFGKVVNGLEITPTANGEFQMKSRFASFTNVPEMLLTWHAFADVKLPEDLDLPTPLLAKRTDGERAPETVVVPGSPELQELMQSFAKRAEKIHQGGVAPEVDNMLYLTTEGRLASLDPRLARGGGAPSTQSKLEAATDTIARVWAENREREYLNPETGRAYPERGAFQLVFCDLGTPSAKWNVYDELRERLSERGMPRKRIRFIQEARSDAQKARLFAAARAGELDVLVGSTQMMGLGANIQTRALALHHLDCPWRPADLIQRDGRIMRQGNLNLEIFIFRYVVEGSFDAYLWQTVERKARFINQIMRSDFDVREIVDLGNEVLSFAEVKALAAGDLLLLDKARADGERTKLERRLRAFARNRQALNWTIRARMAQLRSDEDELNLLLAADLRRTDTKGSAFDMTVGEARTVKRPEAVRLLQGWAASRVPPVIGTWQAHPLGVVGSLGGQEIEVKYVTGVEDEALTWSLRGVPRAAIFTDPGAAEYISQADLLRLEREVAKIPSRVRGVQTSMRTAQKELDDARTAVQRPFKHQDALEAARRRVAQIDAELAARSVAADAPEAETTDKQLVATAERDGYEM